MQLDARAFSSGFCLLIICVFSFTRFLFQGKKVVVVIVTHINHQKVNGFVKKKDPEGESSGVLSTFMHIPLHVSDVGPLPRERPSGWPWSRCHTGACYSAQVLVHEYQSGDFERGQGGDIGARGV